MVAGDGDALQSSLQALTGSRTVPQVFIGQKFLGGCDGERLRMRQHACLMLLLHIAAASTSQVSIFFMPMHADTVAAQSAGKLMPLLKAAGAV